MIRKLLQHLALPALALAAGACTVTTTSIPIAPPGVRVRPEVAKGYEAFSTRLAPWGSWAPDYSYGVHWCPSTEATGGPDASFRPYVSRGRWEASEAPIGQAPAGSPAWKSEDSDTWGGITTHHGWWVRVAGRGSNSWCWVPGLQETPAQVAWREGDGFVGWAPEPPDAVFLVDDGDYDTWYDWSYTLLGTLIGDDTGDNTLSGEAKRRAQAATAPQRSADGSFKRQPVGPSGASVNAARSQLAEYVVKHPDVIAAVSSKRESASSSSGSHASGKSSKAKEAKESKEKEGLTLTAGVAPMPPAMSYYDAFMMEPIQGPAGLVPHVPAGGASGAAGGGMRSGSASASTETASVESETTHAHASHDAATAARAPSSASHASSPSSSGSSGSHSRSSGSGKSSSKSSGRSSRSSGHRR